MRKVFLYIFIGFFIVQVFGSEKWQPCSNPIMTKWVNDINPSQPLPEYPRPIMTRDTWINLNGLWDYSITSLNQDIPQNFNEQILVPFPIESALSGVKKTITDEQKLWYKRTIKIPRKWKKKRTLLHFEAVDWKTEVWINGKKIGEHKGGYDPFSFDITDHIQPGRKNEIMVSVWDPTDKSTQPVGKQTLNPEGIWYTSCTGIWQTVWLECVPKTYIRDFQVETDIDNNIVMIKSLLNNNSVDLIAKYIVSDKSGKVVSDTEFSSTDKTKINLENPILWTPGNPYLYDLKIQLIKKGKIIDEVGSYFGMRKISLGKDNNGITRLMLNNEENFQIGTLDQGFWPDGIYTAPTDEALRWDIEMTKKMGFNMLRKHVKIENRRFYYWCDKLGILVWQDMPSGGDRIGHTDPDLNRADEEVKQYKQEIKNLITSHYNNPSIIMWVPFNEGWGQFDTPGIVDFIKNIDPTRLVNSTSGWADRNVGDVHDIHNYPEPKSPQPEEKRAAVLGEFGGLGNYVKGHAWEEGNWGYQIISDQNKLAAKYEEFFTKIWKLKESPGLSAVVYTQITDVETETNGLVTYDRKKIKISPKHLYKIHHNDFSPMPEINPPFGMFYKNEIITINANNDQSIFYTLDGTDPTINSKKYVKPFEINEKCIVKSIAVNNGKETSRVTRAKYEKSDDPKPIYKNSFSWKYSATGFYGLVDGKKGSTIFSDGKWQGFEEVDLDVIIPFSKHRSVNSIEIGFLENNNSWIFLPENVTVSVSSDGKNYEQIISEEISEKEQNDTGSVHRITLDLDQKNVKYLHVHAKNIGICPEWHKGKGGKAWMFCDEIVIKENNKGIKLISPNNFKTSVDGKPVDLFTLKNSNGIITQITNYGGRVVSFLIPDKDNQLKDIVLGYDSLEDYQKSNERYFGALIGRYGNRIARGKFTLNSKEYTLATNNGKNNLHGGPKGFHEVIWDAKQIDKHTLELKYLSKDMEEGFSGNLNVKVVYTLTNENELKVEYWAETDKPTVVNLTHHSFFNLNGAGEEEINNHILQLLADKYTPVDDGLIPTGELPPVDGTPMDFRKPTVIGDRVDDDFVQLKYGNGYDHNWVLNNWTGKVQKVATVSSPKTGISMDVFTNEPGLQFYGGNFLNGSDVGKDGKPYHFRTALCLETQHFPDSPNQKNFPTTVLNPGEKYHSVCIYKFSNE